jgi:uncharacterized protein
VAAQENIELVKAGYRAFSTGDMGTLSGLFAEDEVWHTAGNGVLSGARQRRDAINVFQVNDGAVTDVGEFFQDATETDAFWA